jgi:ribosomal-protein-alanine N-acetyltransferase
MSLRFRSLGESDLPLVGRWMHDAPEAPLWSDDDLAALVRPATETQAGPRKIRRAWAAEDDSSAFVGFVVATALRIPGSSAECEIEFLMVPPSHRHKGIGRALAQLVLDWAREIAAQQVWLEVRASNMQALRLYERCGFVATGRRPGYYVDPPEDAVLMCVRIGDACGGAPV